MAIETIIVRTEMKNSFQFHNCKKKKRILQTDVNACSHFCEIRLQKKFINMHEHMTNVNSSVAKFRLILKF